MGGICSCDCCDTDDKVLPEQVLPQLKKSHRPNSLPINSSKAKSNPNPHSHPQKHPHPLHPTFQSPLYPSILDPCPPPVAIKTKKASLPQPAVLPPPSHRPSSHLQQSLPPHPQGPPPPSLLPALRPSTSSSHIETSSVHVSSSHRSPSFSFSLRPPELEIESSSNDSEDVFESFHLKDELVSTPSSHHHSIGERKGAVLRPQLLQSKSVLSLHQSKEQRQSSHPPSSSSSSAATALSHTPLEWLHLFSRSFSSNPNFSCFIRRFSVALLQGFSISSPSYSKYEGESQVIAAAVLYRTMQLCREKHKKTQWEELSQIDYSRWRKEMEAISVNEWCEKMEAEGGRWCAGSVTIDRKLVIECLKAVSAVAVNMPEVTAPSSPPRFAKPVYEKMPSLE